VTPFLVAALRQEKAQARRGAEAVSDKKRKPGRPRLTKSKAKGKIVPIRFTKAEAEQLAEAAKRNNQTPSEWIRGTVLAALTT
jgi:hypothetical protein